MAHKKGASSTRNGRDSNSQRLGVKRYGGQGANPGEIIVRQGGTHVHPGDNFRRGGGGTPFGAAAGSSTSSRRGSDPRLRWHSDKPRAGWSADQPALAHPASAN